MTESPMTTQPPKPKRSGIAAFVVFTMLWLGACTQIPELNEAVPNWVRRADYPTLTALDPSLTTQTLPQDESEKIAQDMIARQERLERRAKRLNTPVVDAASQARMKSGISQ